MILTTCAFYLNGGLESSRFSRPPCVTRSQCRYLVSPPQTCATSAAMPNSGTEAEENRQQA